MLPGYLSSLSDAGGDIFQPSPFRLYRPAIEINRMNITKKNYSGT